MFFESIAFLLGTTLMYATPLIYTSLGGTISENSGVVNIGLEGIMFMGAFIGAAIGYYTHNGWIGFLAAGVVGGLFGLLHAVACISFTANQVVSGIAINFLGPGFALLLSRLMFDGAAMTLPLPLDEKISRPLNGVFEQNSFFDMIFNRYSTVYLAFFLVLLVWFVLYKTKLGLRIRSVGEHPEAAATLGISVYKIRYMSVIASGVLAGFGGAAVSIAIVSQFRVTLISGQGFIALAAMIFGKWKPQGAMWACLLFGLAQAIVVFMPRTGIEVSSQLLSMLPYVMTLVLLVIFVGKSVAPSADGKIYEKN
ncbi:MULTISPECIES: ABC transporter permease [unclassified Oceanispirochaeta]|uniref:ABC transporter permease n=1 Tax=unclassified Oceanispirochaeta TaxID=2635722 RepID=UPI000E090B77|nr:MULTISPECIES: ABC transporter permease [unclassified Oceanispirochaeta]MBF9016060.1 ABC transporter permease [Oceanispirochaeta sp. M2]NPD72523.1 ABC transporter permease [Oceanispirochaeta sp. M1]RDG31981.1 ABC transporter permease [Oceanispirochaeta sp. M1]